MRHRLRSSSQGSSKFLQEQTVTENVGVLNIGENKLSASRDNREADTVAIATYSCDSLGSGRPNATTGRKGVITMVSTARRRKIEVKISKKQSAAGKAAACANRLQCRGRRTKALAPPP